MIKTIIFTVEGDPHNIRAFERSVKYLMTFLNLTIPSEEVTDK